MNDYNVKLDNSVSSYPYDQHYRSQSYNSPQPSDRDYDTYYRSRSSLPDSFQSSSHSPVDYSKIYGRSPTGQLNSSDIDYSKIYGRSPTGQLNPSSSVDYGAIYGRSPTGQLNPSSSVDYGAIYGRSPTGQLNPSDIDYSKIYGRSPTGQPNSSSSVDYGAIYRNPSTISSSTSRSYLDSSAKLKVSDYKLDPLELDTATENVKNKPISVLNGNTVEKYYNDLSSSTPYSDLLTNALSGKITDKAELAKVGYFRKHLYENELSKIFSTSLSTGERRNAYEILVNATNNVLKTNDVSNPVNIEMQNVVMPEMMKLMANDGYKITVKKAGVSKADEANKSDATKEFTFDLDDMNWRTQMTNPEFTNYASKVIENLKNPSAKGGYVGMYQKDVLDQRKSFAAGLGQLQGEQAELSRVISASSVYKANTTLSATVKNLDLILTDRLAYGSAYQSYEMAKNQLGDDNVFKTLIIKLASQGEFTVQSSKDRNKSIKININNILGVEDGTNLHLLDNKAVLEELSKRLKNTYK
jgi:hypothetical protein